jgi:hypothetical protein
MQQSEILNAHLDGAVLLEAGTWLGRHQAFGLIANKCSANPRRQAKESEETPDAGTDAGIAALKGRSTLRKWKKDPQCSVSMAGG